MSFSESKCRWACGSVELLDSSKLGSLIARLTAKMHHMASIVIIINVRQLRFGHIRGTFAKHGIYAQVRVSCSSDYEFEFIGARILASCSSDYEFKFVVASDYECIFVVAGMNS